MSAGTPVGAPPRGAPARKEPDSVLGSLRDRLIGGSLWTLAGYGSKLGLRLAGNLILTRLLFPEHFGLMALVQIILNGLTLLSDVGLRASIINDARGEDQRFLDTAWTMQVLRGLYLWLAACTLAWPAATFYGHDELLALVPVAGLSCLIEGFASTARYTLARRVTLKQRTIQEVVTRVVSIGVTVAIALAWRSVWAIVIGSLASSVVSTVWSHRLIEGYRNRFQYDREIARSMLRFGRWVFASTALGFLIGQGDRLFLGKVFEPGPMGVYSVAFFLAQAMTMTVGEISMNVLHPVYARLRELPAAEFRAKVLRIRKALLLLFLPAVWLLVILGPWIVRWLYDPCYEDAGWMLRLLAIGHVGTLIGVTADRVILASGNSLDHLLLQVARAVLLVAGMLAGYAIGQVPGLLIGMSAARIVEYVPLAFFLRKHGAWLPKLDLAVFAISGVVLWLGVWLLDR